MAFMRTPEQFYGLRILLGVAEAGFFPGIIYYLGQWFPAAQRARALSRFIMATPLSLVVGNPLAGWLLGFDGSLGLSGWRWVFLVEGIPSVLLGFITLAFLTDYPEHARWLSGEHRAWLVERLRRDGDASVAPHGLPPLRVLAHPTLWLLSLLYLLYLLTFYGYLYWSTILVRDTLNASPIFTGLVTGLIACVAAVAMLAAGASSDRTGDRCVHMSAGMALVALGYASAALMPSAIGRVVGLGLVLVGDGIFCIPFWCLPSTLLRGSAAAAGIALVNSIGNIGGAVSPYLIGRFKDATGSASGAFLVLAIAAVGAVSMSLMFRHQTAFASRSPVGLVPLVSAWSRKPG
jgi:ACS family tartrate transporter-like MFS transporter